MAQWPAGAAPASEYIKGKQGEKEQKRTRHKYSEGEEGTTNRGQLDVAVQAAAHLKAGRSLFQQTTRTQGRRNPRCMKNTLTRYNALCILTAISFLTLS